MKTLSIGRYQLRQFVRTQYLAINRASQLVPCLSCQGVLARKFKFVRYVEPNTSYHRHFYTSQKSSSVPKDQNLKDPFNQKIVTSSKSHDRKTLQDRYIFVKTLNNFYEDVPDGIILDTAYADSRPGEDFDPIVPVVVGLHDTPGDHHDLVPILATFAKLGCRTIAPTFPGHGNTRGLMAGYDDAFSQTALEKAAFVHDFLSDLEIERVDLLIGVGAACYTMLHLCVAEDTAKFYRSTAFISPWPLQRPRYEPNQDLTRRIQFFWDRPIFRAPVRLLLPAYKVVGAKGVRDKVTTAYLLNNLNLAEATGLALAASVMNIPRVVIYGELDHIVEKELYRDVMDRLGIPETNVTVFSGKLDSPRLPGGLVFPDGGYDLHLKQAGIISAFLLNVLRIFHPHIRI